MTIIRAGLVTALLGMLGAFHAEAQRVPEVQADDRVRLSVQGRVFTGRLHSVYAEGLRVRLEDSATVRSYPLDAVERLEVSRGNGAMTLLRSGGRGWVTGMAVSQVAFLLVEQSSDFSGQGLDYLSAGAFVGLAAGLFMGGRANGQWEEVPVGEALLATGPRVSLARSWVRLRTVDGSVYEGAVRSRGPEGLELLTSDGEPVTVPMASIESLELHQGRRRQPLRNIAEGVVGGAIIGGLIGLVTDQVAGFGCTVGACPGRRVFRYARRGALEGLVAGVVLGAIRRPDRWEGIPVDRISSLAVAPGPGGGITLDFTARFRE